MSVPVIALNGEMPASRWGAGIMTNAGFPEFVADTPDEYVRLAMTFANDLPRLQGIRQTFRDTCPLFCHTGDSCFTSDLERVLREARMTWCNADVNHRKPS